MRGSFFYWTISLGHDNMIVMAVKRIRKVAVTNIEEVMKNEAPVESINIRKRKNTSLLIGLLAILVVLVLFWYKTSTWPIVAMVGFKPITRYEVSKELFKQGGKAVVDDLITRKLINGEIKKNNIEVTPAEIDAKVEEIKSTLGESGNLEDVLAANGTNLADFRKQLELRIGIEKLLSDRIAVSETELDAYLSQNKSLMTSATDEAKRKEASDMLKVSKLQTEANKWVEELKSKARIWTAPGI